MKRCNGDMSEDWKKDYVMGAMSSIAKIQMRDIVTGINVENEKQNLAYFLNLKDLKKPETLYKYIATTKEEDLKDICEGKILLKNRVSLNDPFDGIFTLKRMTEDEILESDYRIAKKEKHKDIPESITLEQFKAVCKFHSSAINMGLKTQCDEYDQHNEFIRRNCYVVGSSSFSEVNPKEKYNLLWPHYANKGKGLCFEYNIEDNMPTFIKSIHPVFYNDTLHQLHQKDWEKGKIIEASYVGLCWKMKMWEYEKEWRYLNYKPIFGDYNHKEEIAKLIPHIEQNSEMKEYIVKNEIIKPSKVYFIKQVSEVDMEILKKMNIEIEGLNLYNF